MGRSVFRILRDRISGAVITFVQICALATVVALTQGGAGATADTPLHVTGTVTNQSSDALAGVSVTATDPGTSTVDASSTTAADGSYELNVAAGSYDLHFIPPIGSNLASMVDRNVTVQSDQSVNALLTAAASTHTFSGVVTDQNGTPIPNIGVEIFSSSGSQVGGVWTDAAGHYSMSLPAGTYNYLKLQSFITGSSSIGGYDLTYPDYGNAGDVTVNLISNDVVQNFSLSLVKLTVVARDSAGNPAVGAQISYTYRNAVFGTASVSSGSEHYSLDVNSISVGSAAAQTSADGTYTVLVPQGGVFAPNNPYVQPVCVKFADTTTRCHTGTITATGDTTINIDELPTHTLSGVVTDQNGTPIPYIGVEPFSDAGVQQGGVWTDATGHYSIVLPAGVYHYIKLQSIITGTTFVGGYELAYPDNGNLGDITLDLSSSDLMQNFALSLVKVHVIAKDSSGNPMPGVRVNYTFRFPGADNFGMATVQSGGNSYSFAINSISSSFPYPVTDANGVYTMLVPQGGTFSVANNPYSYLCLIYADGSKQCITDADTFSTSTDVNVVIQQPLAIPSAPTNLVIPSPTDQPVLSWNAVPGATSYNVYRNGALIGSSTSQTYTDNTAVPGIYNYYVTAVNAAGEGNHSNVANVAVGLTITYSVSPAPNASGWNNSNATVSFTCSSPSGIQSCSAPVIVSSEGANQQITGTAVDNTGSTVSVTATVNVDKTLPTLTYGFSSAPNTNGWYNSPVTVTTTCADALSGIRLCSSSTTFSGDGANQRTRRFAIDNANNGIAVTTTPVNVDQTAPSISYSVSPAPNAAGWNNSNVTVTFTCSDALSGIQSCPAPITVSSDGASQAITGTAVDKAGNTTSVTATINLDKTAPALGTPAWSANPVTAGQDATVTIPASDNSSGVTGGEYYIGTDPGVGNATAMTLSGNALSATFGSNLGVGTYTVGVRAEDNAGNWSTGTTATLVVKPNTTPPTITSAASYSTGMRGPITATDFMFTATGNPTPVLTESGTLPAGITFVDNGNGTANFSGMANAGTNGTYPVTITATNSAGSVSQSFTLTITTIPSVPTSTISSTGSSNLTTSFGGAITPITITATGYPAPSLTETSPLPSGLNFHDNHDGTATISGTPSGNAGGPYTITVTAKNSSGTYSQTYTIYVDKSAVFTPIPNGQQTATVGQTYSVTATTVGFPAPSISASGDLPAGLAFTDNGDGTATISGTPQTGAGGAYPLTLTATNVAGSVTYTFTLKVNEAPVITSTNSDTIAFGTAMTPFTVTTTGYPAPHLAVSGLPSGVNFHDNGDGTATISGTPSGNARGTHTITITATNGTGTATQTFTLVVQ